MAFVVLINALTNEVLNAYNSINLTAKITLANPANQRTIARHGTRRPLCVGRATTLPVEASQVDNTSLRAIVYCAHLGQ
jgi:hypothetical protein